VREVDVFVVLEVVSRGTVVQEESNPVTKTTRTAQMRIRFMVSRTSPAKQKTASV